MPVSDSHSVLGIARGASAEEVKAAYRKAALRCHPDVNNGDAEQFKRITEAYEALLRPQQVALETTPSSYPPFRRNGPRATIRRGPLTAGFGGPAAATWGLGLAIGCCLFGTALFLGHTEMYNHNLHRKGPSRVIYPTADTDKRERIASLLMEKAREGKSASEKGSD